MGTQNPIATANLPGMTAHLNITAPTIIKGAPGRLYKIGVVVAGSAAGSANNVTTTGAAANSNAICGIPNTVGMVDVNVPCDTGIVIVPGTGQTLSAYYR